MFYALFLGWCIRNADKYLPWCKALERELPGRRQLYPSSESWLWPWTGWYTMQQGLVALQSTASRCPSKTSLRWKHPCKSGYWRMGFSFVCKNLSVYYETLNLRNRSWCRKMVSQRQTHLTKGYIFLSSLIVIYIIYLCMQFGCCLKVTMVLRPCADVLTWPSNGDRAVFSKRLNWRIETEETYLKM